MRREKCKLETREERQKRTTNKSLVMNMMKNLKRKNKKRRNPQVNMSKSSNLKGRSLVKSFYNISELH